MYIHTRYWNFNLDYIDTSYMFLSSCVPKLQYILLSCDHCIMWWLANKMVAIFNSCKIDYCHCHIDLHTRFWNFYLDYFYTLYIFICSKVMMHNVIICKSHSGHLGFRQMRHLSSFYRPTYIVANSILIILIPYSFFYLYLFQKVMRHNLIIGK